MKKTISLIRACMTSDMNIFKIKQKKDNKKNSFLLPIFLTFCFMFAIWSNINMIFEKLAPMHLQTLVIPMVILATSFFIIIEGVYKSGPLLFNCKDDQLLLSLPIKRSTVFFVRVFKFYVFELIFNVLFILPLIISYIRWAESLDWTFFLTSFVMIIMLPVIPVVISCIIGVIISNITSKFKFKNLAQIVIPMLIILGVLYLSYNMDGVYEDIAKHATSINDFIMKIYYPAGVYSKLITNFNIIDLLIFILINIVILVVAIFILSRFYFKINSNLKNISTSKKVKIDNLVIKSRSKTRSLIRKELNIFFKTPVFIVNAGFALVMYIIIVIGLSIKYDSVVKIIIEVLPKEIINNYLSIFIFIIITFAAFMTSITNSVISLEGRNINILKSLPIKTKEILLSKVYAALTITTIPIIIGDIILFIRFKLNILEMLLLLVFSILIPLISHFIGIIINLKYPKLDFDNSSEVVKQSTSSFISVLIGMLLLIGTVLLVVKLIKILDAIYILLIFLGIYLIIDIILYTYLIKVSVNDFNKLSI